MEVITRKDDTGTTNDVLNHDDESHEAALVGAEERNEHVIPRIPRRRRFHPYGTLQCRRVAAGTLPGAVVPIVEQRRRTMCSFSVMMMLQWPVTFRGLFEAFNVAFQIIVLTLNINIESDDRY